jgi:hypothetical protein
MVNLICLTWHLWTSAPSAGEATRGYLHGGLLIDFVGQLGPISKFRLVFLDILMVALQIVMLGISQTRADVEDSLESHEGEPTETSGQDLDAEERGVHREEGIEMTGDSGMELRDLSAPEVQGTDDDGEGLDLLSAELEDSAKHPLDSFNNGEAVVAEVYILDLIKSRLSKRGMG